MKNAIRIVAILMLLTHAMFAQNNFTPNQEAARSIIGGANAAVSIDLKAESITFSVVRRIDANRAIIKVEGTIKNVGTDKFVSNQNQQGAMLGEAINFNGLPFTRKNEKLFAQLNPGQTVKVSYEIEWSKSNEFPPFFVLYLNWDPDIRLDGNPKNDDVYPKNDKIIIDGKNTINAINW